MGIDPEGLGLASGDRTVFPHAIRTRRKFFAISPLLLEAVRRAEGLPLPR